MATPHREGTPEKYLACPMGVDADAIYCAIFRAQAVLRLLHCDFNEREENTRSTLKNNEVASALNAVSGYLDQINILMTEA